MVYEIITIDNWVVLNSSYTGFTIIPEPSQPKERLVLVLSW